MTKTTPTIERHRPDFLHNKPHFTNLVISEGGRLAHLSGLIATTPEGELIGPGDLGKQMAFIYDNIGKELATVGATPADIVRQRIFIVDLKASDRSTVMKAMMDFYGDTQTPTSTCVGTPALLTDGALVEIDVTAAIE